MKRVNSILVILASLMLVASLAACGGGAQPTTAPEPAKPEAAEPTAVPEEVEPTEVPPAEPAAPAAEEPAAPAVDSKFPVPANAKIVMSTDQLVIASVDMSMEDTIKFYRDDAAAKGWTEYELLTTITDNVFSMAFRVPDQAEELVVQGTVIAEDNLTLNVRYEETDVN
ncbi:MAG: hypothetical protein GX577_11510 [Leptolinea sp.]|nr:hypothetical protein [Leptolinea sp.]